MALLLLVGGGGFALGVIITIKHNGKSTQVEVPDGARVSIDDQARMTVQVPGGREVPTPSTATATDLESIQGVWQVVDRKGKASYSLLKATQTVNSDGTYTEQWKSSQIVFDKKYMRVIGPHELPKAYEYQINPAGSPKMIDTFMLGSDVPGVYELNGDKLTICFAWKKGNSPASRPTAVWAGLNSTQEMLELRRVGAATGYPDVSKMCGQWIVESAKLYNPPAPDVPFGPYTGDTDIVPEGRIAPGRAVVVTPDELIIQPAPEHELAADTPNQRDPRQGFPPGMPGMRRLQPLHTASYLRYTLDPERKWIGFSTPYIVGGVAGIYQVTSDQLIIRWSQNQRPRSLERPLLDDQSQLVLVRPDSVAGKEILASIEPAKIAEILITVDALGGITAHYGPNQDYLGCDEEAAIQQVKRIAAKHAVQIITLRFGKGDSEII